MVSKENNETIGENVKRERKSKGMSQEKLAVKLKCHRHTILRIEAGEVDVTIGNLCAISDALNINPMKLLQGVDCFNKKTKR